MCGGRINDVANKEKYFEAAGLKSPRTLKTSQCRNLVKKYIKKCILKKLKENNQQNDKDFIKDADEFSTISDKTKKQ